MPGTGPWPPGTWPRRRISEAGSSTRRPARRPASARRWPRRGGGVTTQPAGRRGAPGRPRARGVEFLHGCVEQRRAGRVERQRDEIEARVSRPHALPVDHARDAAVADEHVVGREVPVNDSVSFGHAIAEAPQGLLAARQQLARALGMVSQRREPHVRARARENRRGDNAPPGASGLGAGRRRMQRMQLEQPGRDRLVEREPRLERLPGQLLLQRPLLLDPEVPWRRIAELA